VGKAITQHVDPEDAVTLTEVFLDLPNAGCFAPLFSVEVER
jgi:hypothetical protein